MDWNAIKTEYITDESSSYRKLAKKYGVSLTAITHRAKKENWTNEKAQFKDKLTSETVKKIESEQVNRLTRIHSITDRALDKLSKALEDVDPLDTQSLRQIVASIKDIKEIQMLKSASDIREQEARIAKLQKEAESEKSDNQIEVVIGDGTEDYTV